MERGLICTAVQLCHNQSPGPAWHRSTFLIDQLNGSGFNIEGKVGGIFPCPGLNLSTLSFRSYPVPGGVVGGMLITYLHTAA